MFFWSVMFFIIAIVAGIFGFGGIAEVSIDFARITFVVAIILFILSILIPRRRR